MQSEVVGEFVIVAPMLTQPDITPITTVRAKRVTSEITGNVVRP
jgi:hypothetical protein